MTDPAPNQPTDPSDQNGNQPPEAPKQPADQLADLQRQLKDAVSALDSERKGRVKYETEVAKLKQSQLSESDKVIAKAREEGKHEALKQSGARLAAAEFRAKAATRLGGLAEALDIDLIDFSRFTDDTGEPDIRKIETAVDKLASALPEPNGKVAPTVPGGPRPDPGEQDWLRSAMTR
jgi:hypothetical protein